MSEEYDEEIVEWLRKSREQVGELEPVLVTADGDVLDGRHRLKAYPGWKTQVVQVEDARKIIERVHRNIHRKISQSEIKQAVLQLAVAFEKAGVPKDQLVDKIKEALPFSESYIRKLLPAKYKREYKPKEKPAVKILTEKPQTPTPQPTPKPPEEKALICPICLPPGTIVGGIFREVENISSGFFVQSLTGLVKTENVYCRQYSGPLYIIKGEGLMPLEATPEHPILVSNGSSTLSWKTPAELTEKHSFKHGHYLVMPKPPKIFRFTELNLEAYFRNVATVKYLDKYFEALRLREEYGWGAQRISTVIGVPPATVGAWIHLERKPRKVNCKLPLNEDVAWLLGLYVAEGTHSHKGVDFALGKEEIPIVDKLVEVGRELGYSPCIMEKPTSIWVEYPSRVLARAFPLMMGERAHKKRIPQFIFYHENDDIITSFLEGYVAGDGCVGLRRNREYVSIVTTSKVLALQLQQLYSRLNVFVTIRKRKGNSIIQGRKVNSKEQYLIRGSMSKINENPRRAVKLLQDKVLVPIRKITIENYKGPVYNLGTSDETYVASNVLVHNCGSKLKLVGNALVPA
jgi:intein/homing endonuclease